MLAGLGAERASAALLGEDGSPGEGGWCTEGLVLEGESFPGGSTSTCRVGRSGHGRSICDGNVKNGAVWMRWA